MSKSPSDTPRGGYRMSKVVDLTVQNGKIALRLECGHTNLCLPRAVKYNGVSLEEYIQQYHHLWPGVRQRCWKEHQE